MTYNEWFKSQQGVAYDSMWSFARAAWFEQEITISLLRAELAKAQSEAMKYKLATEKNANALREAQRGCQ